MIALAFLLLFAQQTPSPADLDTIRAEPNPEKRYWRALEYASHEINEARKHYEEGKIEPFQAAVNEVGQSVQLCDETLRATGKNPSKSPKHFKRAELKIREITRRLSVLEHEVGVDDRPFVTKVKAAIQQRHDELLLDIMGRRK